MNTQKDKRKRIYLDTEVINQKHEKSCNIRSIRFSKRRPSDCTCSAEKEFRNEFKERRSFDGSKK